MQVVHFSTCFFKGVIVFSFVTIVYASYVCSESISLSIDSKTSVRNTVTVIFKVFGENTAITVRLFNNYMYMEFYQPQDMKSYKRRILVCDIFPSFRQYFSSVFKYKLVKHD